MLHPKYLRDLLIALAVLWGIVLATATRADTYWLATTDTSGYTIQNVWIDFPVEVDGTQEHPASVGRMALNNVVLADSTTLTRPVGLGTLHVTFNDSVSAVLLATSVSGTPEAILVSAVAEQLVANGTLDTVTVKLTGAGGTTTIASY